MHGYHRIDPELVLPSVRAHVEKNMDFIAKGSSDPVHVTSQLLQIFFQKFQYFVSHVSDIHTYPYLHLEMINDTPPPIHTQVIRMDEFFEASFSSLANAAPKFRSKCGKCRRYMKCLALKYAYSLPLFFPFMKDVHINTLCCYLFIDQCDCIVRLVRRHTAFPKTATSN